MHHFYEQSLSDEEHHRIDMIEPFDEIEEWHSKCAHYILLFGLRVSADISAKWFDRMNEKFSPMVYSRKDSMSMAVNEEPFDAAVHFDLYPTSMTYAQRFGHQSVLVNEKYVWTIGGFGTVDGRHRRLKTIEVLNIDNGDIQRLDNHSLG